MKTVVNWTKVTNMLNNEAKRFLAEAYDMELTIPIKVNGRLKSTLGRFVYGTNDKTPLYIDISKNYIEHNDWNLVIETLKHECIHYAMFMLGRPYNDGHPEFEAELKKHGSHSTRTVKYKGKVVQYECTDCGNKYNRKRRLSRVAYGRYVSGCCKALLQYNGIKYI